MAKNVQPRYVQVVITVPAGTAQATPQVSSWDLGKVQVETIRVTIPPGHAGLTGLAVAYGGVPLIPWQSGSAPLAGVADFLIGDAQEWTFDLHFEISNPLTVTAFNGDVYDHGFYLRAEVRDLSAIDQVTTPIVTVSVSALPDSGTPSPDELLAVAAPPEPTPEELATPASVGDQGVPL